MSAKSESKAEANETKAAQKATPDPSPEKRKIELVPTEKTLDFYSNFADVNWTLFDLTVRFGQITPKLKDSSTWIAEESARVTVSWAQAKILNTFLSALIAQYESVNGKIVRPKLAPAIGDAKVAALSKQLEGEKPN